MHHTHAVAANRDTTSINVAAPPRVNPSGAMRNAGSAELRAIRLKRVDDVAAVATHPVMSASPQTTCPVTSDPAAWEWRMKIPQTSVRMANVYPTAGKRYFAAAE